VTSVMVVAGTSPEVIKVIARTSTVARTYVRYDLFLECTALRL